MEEKLRPGKDFIGVGVFALIQNPGREILLCKTAKSEKRSEEYERIWSMVGGTVEFGETVEQALVREIKEETGLDVKVKKFLGYNDYIKEGKHWVALNFLVESDSNNFLNPEPEKQVDLQWFSLDEIPENISEYTRDSLNRM